MTNNKNKTGLADYIPDKNVYLATMFARKMIRDGKDPGTANAIAAKYYHVNVHEVAKYVGQHASRVKTKRQKQQTLINTKRRNTHK